MRRKKGPSDTEQWEEALKGALTDEKAEYLKRGKLKKCDYRTLCSMIGECVVRNLNAALALFAEGSEEPCESLFRLGVLTETVRKVYFFKELGFIEKRDGEALESRVKNAISDFVGQIGVSVENENADIVYHLSALRRAAGITETA